MDLNVRLEDKLYLNPTTGEIKIQARSSIPFTTPISIRKMKPSLTFAKKVGDVWLGSNKMSLTLLLTYILLKEQKNAAIGFFKYNERFLYIEATVDEHKRTSITMGFTAENETPSAHISVSGKVYDAVFGSTEIKNVDFDFTKAHRELSRKITPLQIGALLVCLSVCGYGISLLIETPPKIEPPKILHKEPPPPSPLTPAETNSLLLLLKDRFIEKYAEVQDTVRKRGHEEWLKSVSVSTAPAPESQAMTVNVTFTYSSYYPFAGAKKEGKTYVWTSTYGEKLGREALAQHGDSKAGPYVCLKYFINYDVIERSKTQWTVSLKEDKSPRVAFLLNLIHSCPCIVRDMMIDDKGLSGTVLLDVT
jgi:hypothetical protein